MIPSYVRKELVPTIIVPRDAKVCESGPPTANDPHSPNNLGGRDTFPPEPVYDWTPITDAMPPEGVLVDTLTSGGRLLQLKWKGRIWRLPNETHYPCYTPDYWRIATP